MASFKVNTKPTLFFHLAAIACILIWGFSFVSTKILVDSDLGPVEIFLYRFSIAYIILLCVSHKRMWAYTLRDELLFLVAGMSSGSIYFITENVALEHTLATNVSLLTSISPLLTTLLIGILYRSQRPGRGVIIGSLIAVIGAAAVIFGGSPDASGSIEIHPLGDFLSLGAALSWAVYGLIVQRLNVVYDVWFMTRKTFFYGVLTGLPFLCIQPSICGIAAIFQWEVLANLLFLGLLASLVSFVLWSIATKGIGPIATNNYLYFQPVVTLIGAVLVLNDSISYLGYIGCALIIAGVWMGDRFGKKKL